MQIQVRNGQVTGRIARALPVKSHVTGEIFADHDEAHIALGWHLVVVQRELSTHCDPRVRQLTMVPVAAM